MSDGTLGILIRARSGPGVLHQLTGVIARHRGDITSVDILERADEASRVYFEVALENSKDALLSELRALDAVREVEEVQTFDRVYGKRIIIVGGGAQVGQVAIGAISEADRHNIRGEHISVDTIPLVGEQPLAEAVRAVVRLPRAKALVLAGSLMGGEIEAAGARGARAGPAGDQPQHGGQRPRSRGPRGDRPGAGRRDGGDGRRRHREVHARAAEAPGLLTRARRAERPQPRSLSRRAARRSRVPTGPDGARTPNARRSRSSSSSSGVGGGVRSS